MIAQHQYDSSSSKLNLDAEHATRASKNKIISWRTSLGTETYPERNLEGKQTQSRID